MNNKKSAGHRSRKPVANADNRRRMLPSEVRHKMKPQAGHAIKRITKIVLASRYATCVGNGLRHNLTKPEVLRLRRFSLFLLHGQSDLAGLLEKFVSRVPIAFAAHECIEFIPNLSCLHSRTKQSVNVVGPDGHPAP